MKKPITFEPAERPKTFEEVKAAGQRAADLLGSPQFNLAYRALLRDLQEQSASTAPEARNERQWYYDQMYALGAVVTRLGAYFREAEALDESVIQAEREGAQAQQAQLQ